MAKHLQNWGTYWTLGGSGDTTDYNKDAWGLIKVYLDSQSIENNSSSIYIDHYIYYKNKSGTAGSSSFTSKYRANNGSYGGTYKSVSKSLTMSYTDETSVYIGRTWHTVNHNSDGKASLYVNGSISCTFDNGTSGSTTSAFTKVALPTIPRTSKITCPSFNIGDSTVINIERYSDSFTDTLTWEFGELSGTIVEKTSLTSIGFTPEAADFFQQIPNETSKTGKITCNTYNGETLIGTSTCEFTAYVVEEKPDISATVVDTNDTTIALTGDSNKIIKYMSEPKVTINATAKNYAEIASYKLNADGVVYDTQETTLDFLVSKALILSATDTRGYSNNVDFSVPNFIDYIKPSFTKKVIERPETTSTVISVDLAGTYYNDSFGDVNNTISLKYRTRIKDGTWSDYTTVSPTVSGNTFTYTANIEGEFSIDSEYEVEFIVADKLSSDPLTKLIEKGLGVVEIGDEMVNVNGILYINDVQVLEYEVVDTW